MKEKAPASPWGSQAKHTSQHDREWKVRSQWTLRSKEHSPPAPPLPYPTLSLRRSTLFSFISPFLPQFHRTFGVVCASLSHSLRCLRFLSELFISQDWTGGASCQQWQQVISTWKVTFMIKRTLDWSKKFTEMNKFTFVWLCGKKTMESDVRLSDGQRL